MTQNLEIALADMQRYRDAVASIEMSDAQKDEVIFIVYRIMQSFVDQAFEIDPVQFSYASRDFDSSQSDSSHANLISYSSHFNNSSDDVAIDNGDRP